MAATMIATAPAAAADPGAWVELRDAASAVRLAVQLLNGPLAPWSAPPPDETRMREVIGALDQATRRMCKLVTQLQPSANDRPAPMRVVEPAPSPAAAAAPAPVAAAPVAPPPARPRARAEKRAEPPASTEVDAMLHQLEITVVTRSDPPALLSVHVAPGLHVAFDRTVLLHTLARLVDDAAALGPAPDTTVSLHAYLDPTEELGDGMDVVFEVRPDPRAPAAARAWSQAAPAPPAGLTLSTRLLGGQHCALLRVPARPAAR